MKASPIEVNESVSDAAANTSRSPDTASVLHAGAPDTGSEPVGALPGGADADAVAATPLRVEGGERREDHLRPCHWGSPPCRLVKI